MDPLKALADAERKPYWLDSPAKPEPLTAALRKHRPPTSRWSAAASRGCGPRCWPRNAIPSLDVVLLEGRRIGWAASGRNGGFCWPRSPTASPTGWSAGPTRSPRWSAWASTNLDEIERGRRRYGIDCDFERTGELHVATEPWQLEATERARRASPASWASASTSLDQEQVRAEVELAHLPRRPVGPRRLRHARPRPAGLGAAAGLPRRWACASTSARRSARMTDDRGGHGPAHPARHGRGAPRSRSAPACSSRCCGGCSTSSCRSTTTR